MRPARPLNVVKAGPDLRAIDIVLDLHREARQLGREPGSQVLLRGAQGARQLHVNRAAESLPKAEGFSDVSSGASQLVSSRTDATATGRPSTNPAIGFAREGAASTGSWAVQASALFLPWILPQER